MREHASGLQNCISVSRGPSSFALGIFTWKKKRRGMSAARAWHASSLRSCSFPEKLFLCSPTDSAILSYLTGGESECWLRVTTLWQRAGGWKCYKVGQSMALSAMLDLDSCMSVTCSWRLSVPEKRLTSLLRFPRKLSFASVFPSGTLLHGAEQLQHHLPPTHPCSRFWPSAAHCCSLGEMSHIRCFRIDVPFTSWYREVCRDDSSFSLLLTRGLLAGSPGTFPFRCTWFVARIGMGS